MAIFLLRATPGPSLPSSVKYLWAIGGVCMFVGWSLFFRTVVELNKVLPPSKKFLLFELRMHIDEIKNLHEGLFPVSALRTGWFLLTLAGGLAMAAGVIIGIRPTH